MRILVASTYTIPAFSGGWTTPLDLFGTDHQAMYVIRNYKPGSRFIEEINVAGVGATGILHKPWNVAEKYRHALIQKLFRIKLKKCFAEFNADFVLCIDPSAGYAAMEAELPYALRFHSNVAKEYRSSYFAKLLDNAIFSTACPQTHMPDIEVLAHNQDLSRFKYIEHPVAERALLLTSIDPIHEPELFIEGVMLSKNVKGDIVGTGEDRKKISAICKKTNGKVRCLPPVSRLKIPELMKNYQIGVATVTNVSPIIYQMKVNTYMASGLYTLAKPWTHIVSEAPDLVGSFTTARELAEHLDYLNENWLETLETRRKAKEWIHQHYNVEIPRKRFNEILSEKFGS